MTPNVWDVNCSNKKPFRLLGQTDRDTLRGKAPMVSGSKCTMHTFDCCPFLLSWFLRKKSCKETLSIFFHAVIPIAYPGYWHFNPDSQQSISARSCHWGRGRYVYSPDSCVLSVSAHNRGSRRPGNEYVHRTPKPKNTRLRYRVPKINTHSWAASPGSAAALYK